MVKLKIRPRMVTGFLIMSGLLVVLGISAIFYTNRMQENTRRILDENVTALKASEELEIALMDMKGITANYLLDNNPQWLDTFAEKKDAFLNWYDESMKTTHTPQEQSILNEIKILFENYQTLQKEVVKKNQDGDLQQAYLILSGEMRETFNQIYEKCEDLLFINESLMKITSQLIDRDNLTVNRIMYGIGFIGILLGLVLGLILSKSITHPIYELVLKLKGATDGEIVEKLDISADTELEHLGKYVKNIVDKITEVNKSLERSQQMLIQQEKLASLGRMAAGLAHEIRNPLTAIKMLIFSIQNESRRNTQISRDINVIVKEIKRMEVFLQNFLDFARPPLPKFTKINVNEVIYDSLNLLNPQIKAAKIQLQKNLDTENMLVQADKEQLRQVIINIILNAIESIPRAGLLKITTSVNQSEPDSFMQIKIHDNGKGIAEEILPTIFDPFVTDKENGTGLGLSIAYQIISNHGGWIDVSNNEDKGATFIINLPLNEVKV